MYLEFFQKRIALSGPALIGVAFLVFLSAYILAFFTSVPDANATGGAYKNTKHGGGVVDGKQFSGVNRGVNPDYGIAYNTNNPEAGEYKPGECAHCHEPHSSFGGSEPEPSSGSTADSSGGPNKYLGMADPNQEFCWYCHENMNFDPTFGGGTGYWKFYQGKARYQESGHYQNTTMLNPGYGSGSPWPRTNRTNNLLYGHCLNCHTTHGVQSSTAAYDTWAVPASKQTTSGNASVSSDYLIPRQLISWEEALCENCHKSTSEGGLYYAKDIRTQLAKLDGAYGTYGSGHPVHNGDQTGSSSSTTFAGRHSLANESTPSTGNWNAYSNNTRHVECYDCHNPHVAKKGTSGPNLFRKSGENATGRDVTIGPVQLLTPDGYGGANSGVWGVNVNTSTGDITGRLNEARYLYQLCIKCHSSYADSSITTQQGYSGPQAPSWLNKSRFDGQNYTSMPSDAMYLTNVAKDFATDDPASVAPPKGYHPVFALGRNRPPLNANPRWSVTFYSDTSGDSWDSGGTWNGGGSSSNRPTGIINAGYGFRNNFVPPWGPDAYVTCVDCHEDSSENTARGPHGSDRPFILRKLDTSITYTVLDDGSGHSKTVSYSSFDYGYRSNTSYNSHGPVNLGVADPNNLCLNCHRADVYGFYGQASGGAMCSGGWGGWGNADAWPRYRFLARQPHPVEGGTGGGLSFAADCDYSSVGNPPRGIVCLRCHGGGSVGGIHGNLGNRNGYTANNSGGSWGGSWGGGGSGQAYNYNVSYITPSSNRLLNGTAWYGVKYGTTSQTGSCNKGDGSLPFNNNSCTNGASGSFDHTATYNY